MTLLELQSPEVTASACPDWCELVHSGDTGARLHRRNVAEHRGAGGRVSVAVVRYERADGSSPGTTVRIRRQRAALVFTPGEAREAAALLVLGDGRGGVVARSLRVAAVLAESAGVS